MNQQGQASLLRTIALWLTAVMVGAVAASGLLMYWQFNSSYLQSREQTLRGQAELLVRAAHDDGQGGVKVELPLQAQAFFLATRTHYVITDQKGTLLTASEGVAAPLWLPAMQRALPNEEHGFWPFRRPSSDEIFFVTHQLDPAQPHYGLSRVFSLGDRTLLAQVASTDEELRVDTEIEEYIDHVGWFWIPFILLLLGVNLWVIHRGLQPLRDASQMAARIGPQGLSERLPVENMPREVAPLVEAVNHALDRLEAGYNAQRDFLADVTHELRTPLAVLKVQISLLQDADTAQQLLSDLGQLERLVAQLLDVARLDVLRVGEKDECDLTALAHEVAEYMAPLALSRNRSIELDAPCQPIRVRGVHDFLFRALRNLIENALEHTPVGTAVLVSVREPAVIMVEDRGSGVPEDQRRTIFERFWQARRDRGTARKGGVGLGMAIVARTMKEHRGQTLIEDRDGGGARFILQFPSGEDCP